MSFADERRVTLQGASNFRDVGGLVLADGRSVRRGLLFRSDALGRLTKADLSVVERLGLRTVIDLRTHSEQRSSPDRLPAGSGIRCVHLPMSDPSAPSTKLGLMAWLVRHGPSTDFARLLQQQYTAFAFRCTGAVGSLVRSLAEPENLPALVHCNAGKDRTGFTMAMLLLSLGCKNHDVIADHVITNVYLKPAIARYLRALRWFSLGRVGAAQVMPLLEARAEQIELVVQEICESYGSLEGWLERACGVNLAAQRSLSDLLLTLPCVEGLESERGHL